jgi:hypothetical protein
MGDGWMSELRGFHNSNPELYNAPFLPISRVTLHELLFAHRRGESAIVVEVFMNNAGA